MQFQANLQYRMKNTRQAKFIAKACKRIATKLKSDMSLQQRIIETLGQQKYAWAQSITENNSVSTPPLLLSPKPPPSP